VLSSQWLIVPRFSSALRCDLWCAFGRAIKQYFLLFLVLRRSGGQSGRLLFVLQKRLESSQHSFRVHFSSGLPALALPVLERIFDRGVLSQVEQHFLANSAINALA
jgi:hypothetical protein